MSSSPTPPLTPEQTSAVPNTVVPVGSLLTPGGGQGIPGAAGPTAVSSEPGNLATLGSNDGLIYVPSGAVVSAVTPTIYSVVRTRSFNALGNPNMEVGQADAGSAFATSTTPQRLADRWFCQKQGAASLATIQQRLGSTAMGNVGSYQVVIPGTNFIITNTIGRITLNAQLNTLNPGDLLFIRQYVDGPFFRELQGDVHSLSLLVRCSLATFNFGVTLTDNSPGASVSLTKLASITQANNWTLIPLANLPIWPNNGSFSSGPGQLGYVLTIVLAAGSTWMTPVNDTWQNAEYYGAVGQSNFGALPVGTTFDIAFVQHEPGPGCTPLMNIPFSQNLHECQRYYQQTCTYGALPTNPSPVGVVYCNTIGGQSAIGWFQFVRRMARTPTTIIGYSGANGNPGYVHDTYAAVDRFINNIFGGTSGYSDAGFMGFLLQSVNPAATYYDFHYSTDTGW